ncbi:hypothetical protein ACFL1I_03675 [Candidatus Omnitrophota bacterium]
MNRRPNCLLPIILFLPLLCYLLGLLVLSNVCGSKFNEVNIFNLPQESGLIKLLLCPLVALSGLLTLFICPGLAWFIGFEKKMVLGLRTFIYAFLISLAWVEVIVVGLRSICLAGINRADFILAIFAVTLLGNIFGFFRKGQAYSVSLIKIDFTQLTIAATLIFVIGLFFVSMSDKIFVEDLNNDGHEIFWHSLYLAKALPYTNLPEVAYLKLIPTMSFILLFGKAVASLRISYFFYLALIYMVAGSLINAGQQGRNQKTCFILIGHLLLFSIFMFFQPYAEPYHVDLVTVVADLPFLLLSLCLAYTLIEKRYSLSVITAALLLQCVHYAFVMLVLILLSYWFFFREERQTTKPFFLKIIILLAVMLLLFLLHARQYGYLGAWPEAIKIGLLSHFFGVNFSIRPIDFIAEYSLLVGGLPILMIILLWKKDKVSNFVCLVASIYFLILLFSKHKTVHTLTPIAFLPVIGFLRSIYFFDGGNIPVKALKVSHAIILIICIGLLWPLSYQPHTQRRDFWKKSQFIYPNDIVYIDNFVEDNVKQIFLTERLGHIFSGTWELYSFISDSFSPQFDYYFTEDIGLLQNELKIVAHYNDTYFLTRSLPMLKKWQDKSILSVEKRYVNFLKILLDK